MEKELRRTKSQTMEKRSAKVSEVLPRWRQKKCNLYFEIESHLGNRESHWESLIGLIEEKSKNQKVSFLSLTKGTARRFRT